MTSTIKNTISEGYIYAPYIPVIETPLIHGSYTPKDVTKFGEKELNGAFYGKVYIGSIDPITPSLEERFDEFYNKNY